MTWIREVKERLLPLSYIPNPFNFTFEDLIGQWDFTGECFDYHPERADCKMCGHEKIRYGFTIKNRLTGKSLVVGSVCITKINLATTDELKRLADLTTQENKYKKVFHALSYVDPSFRDNYIQHGALTPKQAAFVFKSLFRQGIPFDKTDFKIRTKSKKHLNQLKDPEIYFEVSPSLPPSRLMKIKQRVSRAILKGYLERSYG